MDQHEQHDSKDSSDSQGFLRVSARNREGLDGLPDKLWWAPAMRDLASLHHVVDD